MSDDKKTTSPKSKGGGSPSKGAKVDCPCTDGKLVKLTVIRNATQTHVTGAKNWAAVKKSSDEVVVEATTSPNCETCWQQIVWSGDVGSPGDAANQRKLPRGTSAKLHIEAEMGGVQDFVDVWIVWANLTVTIGTSDTIDSGNDAPGLASGHNWPSMIGGGNKLGPMSKEGTSLTYAYTVGKMQAKATLTPAGVEDVVSRSSWLMRRTKTKKAFDNAVLSDSASGSDDTSASDWLDLDPKSGSSTRELYDLDAPGCSNTLSGTTVDHTAELYENFRQFVAVVLDSEEVCSDKKTWSYQARVDVDKPSGKVELNELSLSDVSIPTGSHYTTR